MERVELHCHSKYSEMDGLASPYDIVKLVCRQLQSLTLGTY